MATSFMFLHCHIDGTHGAPKSKTSSHISTHLEGPHRQMLVEKMIQANLTNLAGWAADENAFDYFIMQCREYASLHCATTTENESRS